MSSPLTKTDKGIILNVRLAPKSSKNSINKIEEDADGNGVIKISVTTVPEKGKANKALIDLLSKELKIPKKSFSIISGETDKNKKILIDSDINYLEEKLKEYGV